MIQHNFDPVLFDLGFLEIRYYSLAYLFGLFLAYFLLKRAAEKGTIKKLSKRNLEDLFFYLAVGLIAGARILYFVFYNPSVFWTDPLELFKLWHGGMSFHGGLIGSVIAMAVFSRKHGVRFYDIADLAVIPGAIALFLGRLLNFVNGELIGTPSDLPFCIKYRYFADCRHPSQIYEALKNLAIFFTLFSLRKRKLRPGTLFWLFVLMYGALRFLVTFFRDDPRLLGLSMGQYLSLAMVLAAGIVLFTRRST
jgi:phosphatidylglycerol:prolipoprotein diacylglycerol transferase